MFRAEDRAGKENIRFAMVQSIVGGAAEARFRVGQKICVTARALGTRGSSLKFGLLATWLVPRPFRVHGDNHSATPYSGNGIA